MAVKEEVVEARPVCPLLCLACSMPFETQEQLKEHEKEVHKKRTTQSVGGDVRGDPAMLSKEVADLTKQLAAANAELDALAKENKRLKKSV